MKKLCLVLLIIVFQSSCIPIRIAPNISDYKLSKGNRFRKGLPKKTVFVFEDPKEAGDFYDYINTKYQLNDHYVDVEVPFSIEENQYYFSFYEVEIPTKTINLIPILLDKLLTEAVDTEPIFNEVHTSRMGNYYLAIEVYSNQENDCLAQNSSKKEAVLAYLRHLKKEYLLTDNYNEVIFKD
ncbi:MAG: hypothetical protein HKP38_07490 [Croceitalea sp.]|nr:hypothetical protein [Croceitalea sp.]